MKKTKLIFVSTLLLLSSLISHAQSINASSFTVQSYMGMYLEGEEWMSYETNEIYNISFADGFMVHNILTDGTVSDSQVYKISNVQNFYEDGEDGYSFEATSGVSGKVYYYTVSTDLEGITTLILTQPNGVDQTVFMTTLAILKSYRQ
ncbi:MAG: hypothetical protein ACO29Q_10535 [Crocinitomicaceae bacterium]